MQQTIDATLFCIFLPRFAKARIWIIFSLLKKELEMCLPIIYSCSVIKHRIWPSLAEAWFPALWFSPLRVFTICLPVITTTISCFELYYRKRFPVCFFKLEGDFVLKLRWMQNFHESGDKTICKFFSSCLYTKLGVISFCLKCPGQHFFSIHEVFFAVVV